MANVDARNPMRLLACCLAVAALPCPTRGEAEWSGRLTPRVVCQANASQAYALFVPSAYSADRTWPVIFCFDAGARGQLPVERLKPAAERYGYIVAGSLNSRNGPWKDNAAAAEAMMTDVHARLAIDPSRIYAAGMSGGARVATRVAMSGRAHGVIGCGAGFPVPLEAIPAEVPFAYLGTCGTEDFNYPEMRQLEQTLAERHAVHRLVVFAGGHEWAPETVMTEAVEWLELQALRAGTRPRDEGFIQSQLQSRLAAVPEQPPEERWRALHAIAADFRELADTTKTAEAAAALSRTREVKQALRAEQELFKREARLIDHLGSVAIGDSMKRKTAIAAEVRRKADAPTDTPERRMHRRVIASYFSMSHETVHGFTDRGEHAKAAAMLEMRAALRPDQPKRWFELARAHALAGNTAEAVEALNRAAQVGFDDASALENEPAFARLEGEPAFRHLLRQISVNAAEPVVALPELHVSAALEWMDLRFVFSSNQKGGLRTLSYLRVEAVRPNSVAAVAGIKPGLQVTAIQGLRINGLTEPEFTAAIAQRVENEIIISVRDWPGGPETNVRLPLRPEPVLTPPAEPRT